MTDDTCEVAGAPGIASSPHGGQAPFKQGSRKQGLVLIAALGCRKVDVIIPSAGPDLG